VPGARHRVISSSHGPAKTGDNCTGEVQAMACGQQHAHSMDLDCDADGVPVHPAKQGPWPRHERECHLAHHRFSKISGSGDVHAAGHHMRDGSCQLAEERPIGEFHLGLIARTSSHVMCELLCAM